MIEAKYAEDLERYQRVISKANTGWMGELGRAARLQTQLDTANKRIKELEAELQLASLPR